MFMNMSELSDLINNALKDRGWSQTKLANLAGVSKGSVSNYASDKVTTPDEDTLIKIGRVLNLSPETILRVAGLLPPKKDIDPITAQIIHLVSQMDDVDKKAVLSYCNLVVEESRMRDAADEFLHRYDRLDRVEKMEAQKKLLRGLGLVATSRQGSG
jgi:transcriptional regulator with XRE-family HTH domain